MPDLRRVFVRTTFLGLVLLGALVLNQSLAQTGTTRGREFYISVMPNAATTNDNQIRIYLATLNEANVRMEVIGTDYTQAFLMTPNSSFILDIPNTYYPTGTEIIEQIGIYIESDAEINAYALNQANATTDGAMILPWASLSDYYMVHSYNVPPPQTSVTPQQFAILATEDSTMVDITFSAPTTVDGNVTHQAGESIVVELMRGQQIIYNSTGDMSGTIVRSRPAANGDCKKIAVFAGHLTTLVGTEQGPDHLYEQMYAVADWGTEYVMIPSETRFTGDVVKVLAAEDNTQVRVLGGVDVLNQGESVLYDFDEVTYIEADKPISVIQLTKGRQADSNIRGDQFADPFMTFLSPANQTVNELAFILMTNFRMERHYVNVVTPSENLAVFLNDQDISDRFRLVPGNTDYSYASFSLNPTFHRLASPNGFVAHAYAFGEAESIGYALGGDLGDFRVRIEDEQQGVVSDGNFAATICEASELTLTVGSDIAALKDVYTVFEWDMGDGTVLLGDTVRHNYGEPGSFPVRMTASKAGSNCSNVFVDRLIQIIPDGIEGIIGPASVCPDAQDINYEATGTLDGYTYEWFVDGGNVDGSRFGTSVTVDWAIADPGARVRVLARSPTGCLSDTINFDVVLNEFLEPLRPIGPAQLCTEDITSIGYFTPPATGSTYTWEVDGGTIVSGQGTNQVQVAWNGIGTHSIWYTESTSTVSSLCDGTSPPLQVTVFDPLVATPEITPVSCFGQSDGRIRLEVSGGLGPYEVRWATGETGIQVGSRSAGTYSVTVTDALGCELEQEVIMTQPQALSGFMEIQDAVCNGFRGTARAVISGGTAPYSYDWSTDVPTTSSLADQLGRGQYSVRVTDVNDCEIILNFDIAEPSALVAELTMEQACPGASDGRLVVDVSGGVAPYTYNWEFAPGQNDSELSDITDGSYNLSVVDAAGCTLDLTGVVTNQTPRISIPTAFSPNGDGDNETFGPVYNCALDFRMIIYNRWGNVVFSSTDIDTGWDGNFEGKPVPAGSYTYDAQYSGVLNGTPFVENVRGYLKVVR